MSSTLLTESAEKLQAELRELRVQHYTLKEQHDDLKEKMKFFSKVIYGPLQSATIINLKLQGYKLAFTGNSVVTCSI